MTNICLFLCLGKQTPLHEAAYKGTKDCCRELILHGANPHAKNDLGRTPLLDACNQGVLLCFGMINLKHFSPPRCALKELWRKLHLTTSVVMIEKYIITFFFAILFLLIIGNLPCAIHCLDAGCFVNQTDHNKNTPLHHLLKHQGKFFLDDTEPGKLNIEQIAEFTDVLLQYGANPYLANEEEETPFFIANSMQENDVLDVINTAQGR